MTTKDRNDMTEMLAAWNDGNAEARWAGERRHLSGTAADRTKPSRTVAL